MSRRRTFEVVSYVIGGILLIGSLTLRLNSWQERGYVAGFYVGAGCVGFLFHQWRRRGNLAARAWCLGAFGTWALTVMVGSVDDSAATIVAGLALGVGFVGALTTLLKMRSHRRQSQPAPLDR
ncbi:hypothetical protein [Streptomyces kaempferi]|uniref:Integral membrane protein n=1 Tax=Streptomyces kaempferi TaxID=333725 RepID=A0ABW3XC68_9ACTN